MSPETVPLTLPATQPVPRWAWPLIAACAAVSGLAGYAAAEPVLNAAFTSLVAAIRWWGA